MDERFRQLHRLNNDSQIYFSDRKAVAKKILDLSEEGFLVYEIVDILGISKHRFSWIVKTFLEPIEILEYEDYKKNNMRNKEKTHEQRAYENRKLVFRKRILKARKNYISK